MYISDNCRAIPVDKFTRNPPKKPEISPKNSLNFFFKNANENRTKITHRKTPRVVTGLQPTRDGNFFGVCRDPWPINDYTPCQHVVVWTDRTFLYLDGRSIHTVTEHTTQTAHKFSCGILIKRKNRGIW